MGPMEEAFVRLLSKTAMKAAWADVWEACQYIVPQEFREEMLDSVTNLIETTTGEDEIKGVMALLAVEIATLAHLRVLTAMAMEMGGMDTTDLARAVKAKAAEVYSSEEMN